MKRSDFTRPIAVAITFTLFGEALIFLLWGIYFFPGGNIWNKAVWTASCGLAMGATIGALVNLLVTGRMFDSRAAWASGLIFFVVLALCTYLCFQIDLRTGSHFGAAEAPVLFLAGGLIPAILAAFAYSWLLFSKAGTNLLSKIGY